MTYISCPVVFNSSRLTELKKRHWTVETDNLSSVNCVQNACDIYQQVPANRLPLINSTTINSHDALLTFFVLCCIWLLRWKAEDWPGINNVFIATVYALIKPSGFVSDPQRTRSPAGAAESKCQMRSRLCLGRCGSAVLSVHTSFCFS